MQQNGKKGRRRRDPETRPDASNRQKWVFALYLQFCISKCVFMCRVCFVLGNRGNNGKKKRAMYIRKEDIIVITLVRRRQRT